LPSGEYFAEAEIIGVEPVASAYQMVQADKTTIFHLTLQPQDVLGKLTGIVAHQISDKAKQPLARWDVIAVNQSKDETRKATTDRKGKYELSLPDSSWWIHAQPKSDSDQGDGDPAQLDGATADLGATSPVTVEITPDADFEHDITIAQSTEINVESLHIAVVGVQGAIGDQTPEVQFDGDQSTSKVGQTEKLSAQQLEDFGIVAEDQWSWFTSSPSTPLGHGQYTAIATLPEYGARSSSTQQVAPKDSTFFHITMLAPTKPGSITGRVLLAGTDPGELIPEVDVELRSEKHGSQRLSSADGNFKVDQLQPGVWWASAAKTDFDLVKATPVEVKANENAEVDVLLKSREPPASKLLALIGVQNGTTELPQAEFVGDNENPTWGSEVRPIDIARAQTLTSSQLDPNWKYYVAKPSGKVPTGSYLVSASVSDHEAARSEPKNVLPGFKTLVEVSLFDKQIDDDELQTDIHGRVYGQDTAGNLLELVAGASVEFIDQSGLTVGSAVTDLNGYYSILNMPPGTLRYKVTAAGYQNENVGRSIDLQPSEIPLVFDFTVVKGEGPKRSWAELAVGVWTENEAGQDVRVDNAAVTIWPSSDPQQRKVLPVPGGRDYELPVRPSVYWVSATAEGFGSSVADPITVELDAKVKHKIYLQPAVGDVRVLVSVHDPSKAKGIDPIVQVQSVATDSTIPTSLSPIGQDELQFLGELADQQGTVNWYWATVEAKLAPGFYFAHAQLEGFDIADSAIKRLESGTTTIFHVSLRAPDQVYRLAGTVNGTQAEGRPFPLPGAIIHFDNRQTEDRRFVTVGPDGQYSIVLEPGTWWATPAPPISSYRFRPSPPKRIEIVKSKNTKQDFLLSEWPEGRDRPRAPRVFAIVEVVKSDQPSSDAPHVSFINERETIYSGNVRKIAPAQLSRLGIESGEGSDWYIATVGVQPGFVMAEAKLAGYQAMSSVWKQAVAGRRTTFFLTLRSKQQIKSGKLIAKVFESGFENEKFIEHAWIEMFRNSKTPMELPTLGGIVGPKSIPAGPWWIRAHAEGYISSEPQLIKIASDADKDLSFALKPIPNERPLQPILAMISVEGESNCRNGEAPTAEFVSEQLTVPAAVRLLSDQGATAAYAADPTEPLRGGVWHLRATLGEVAAVSATKSIDRSAPTTFNAAINLPTPKVAINVSVWPNTPKAREAASKVKSLIAQRDSTRPNSDAYKKLDSQIDELSAVSLSDASTTLLSSDPQRPQITLVANQQTVVEPGMYWAVASAPGYQSSPMKEVNVGCVGPIDLNLTLDPVSTQDQPLGELIAIVRVIGGGTEEVVEPETRYYYSPRQGITLVAQQTNIQLTSVPTVDFIQQAQGNRASDRIRAEVVELSQEQFAEYGIEPSEADKWYWARSNNRRPGRYTAQASLEDYSDAVSSPKRMTSAQPAIFNLVLSKSDANPGNGYLAVQVNSQKADPYPVSGATVSIQAEGRPLQSAISETDGWAKFEVSPGSWNVSVQAEQFASYSHAEAVSVPSAGNETINVNLQRAAAPELRFGPIDVVVGVAKSAPGAPPSTPNVKVKHQVDGAPSVLTVQDLRKLSENQMIERGVPFSELPLSKWDWYAGTTEAPPLPQDYAITSGQPFGTVTAGAALDGYESSFSVQKPLLSDSKTTLDVVLYPIRPRFDLFVQRSDSNGPAAGVTVKIWSPELGQSLTNADRFTTDRNGRVNGQLPRIGSYTILAAADTEEFEPYNASLSIDQKSWSHKIMLDPGSKSASPPISSLPSNPEFDSALCKLLNQGWETPADAQQYYDSALKADPSGSVAPFAMSLIEAKQGRADAANGLLDKAIATRDDKFVWDRAVEAKIRLLVQDRKNREVARVLRQTAAIYKSRPANPASLETAKLMGTALSVLQATRRSDDTDAPLQRAIEADLNAEHLQAFQSGLAEGSNGLAAGGQTGDAATKNEAEIAELNNKRSTAENLISQYQQQIDNKRKEFNPKQKELDQLIASRNSKSKELQQLKDSGQGNSQAATEQFPREIIAMGLKIRTLNDAKAKFETEIKTMTEKQQAQKNNIVDIDRQLGGMVVTPQPKPGPSTVGPDPSTVGFDKLPLDKWRQELIDRLSPCGNEDGEPGEANGANNSPPEINSPPESGDDGNQSSVVALSGNLYPTIFERVQESRSIGGKEKTIVTKQSKQVQLTDVSILLEPVGGGQLPVDLQRPITPTAWEQGYRFSWEDVPEGEYIAHATGTDFDVRSAPFHFSPDNRSPQAINNLDIVLRDSRMEEAIHGLLTEGWENQSAASKYFRQATALDSYCIAANYAAAMVLVNDLKNPVAAGQLQTAAAIPKTNGMRGIPNTLEFHRANELLLYLTMSRKKQSESLVLIVELAREYSAIDLSVTRPTLDTAYLMGVSVGMMLGPWAEMRDARDAPSTDQQVITLLTGQLRDEYDRGRDETLELFRTLDQTIVDEQDSDRTKFVEQTANQIATIRFRIDEIEQEMTTLKQDDAADKQKVEYVVAEIDRTLQPMLVDQRRLRQSWNTVKIRIRQFESELVEMQKCMNRRAPVVGQLQEPKDHQGPSSTGDIAMEQAKPNRDKSLQSYHLVGHVVAQRGGRFNQQRNEGFNEGINEGINPSIERCRQRARQLRGFLTQAYRRLRGLESELGAMAGSIQTQSNRRTSIQRQYNSVHRQRDRKYRSLEKELASLRRNIDRLQKLEPKPSTDLQKQEREIAKIETYYEYNLLARRQELLNLAETGIESSVHPSSIRSDRGAGIPGVQRIRPRNILRHDDYEVGDDSCLFTHKPIIGRFPSLDHRLAYNTVILSQTPVRAPRPRCDPTQFVKHHFDFVTRCCTRKRSNCLATLV
jgi:hypothetical protein